MSSVNKHYSKKTNYIRIPKDSIDNCFEKKFKYEEADDWILPATDCLFTEKYNITSLQQYKIELNNVKSLLNNYPIEEWNAHTCRRNPAGTVAGYLKNQVKAEFVTQAWCKFYECLHQYDIVSGPKLCSVHLCEAPGAFIAALNHYLHSTYTDIEWDWLATTLNPYYEGNALSKMLTDDRFMLHTLDKWMMGVDFTGNIISKENIIEATRLSEEIGTIKLVTADGSIDCMENPDSQEETVSTLQYAELCAALKILSEDGSLVLKVFTLFESSSVCIIYLLNCVFREVNVYKPATSKCGNSEAYVICLGFRKNTRYFPEILETMLNQLDNPGGPLPIFSRDYLPESFLIQHIACAKFFMDHQLEAIISNINAYERKHSYDIKYCNSLRNLVCENYLKIYKIDQIPPNRTILFDKQATVHYEFHKKIYTGSYTARSQQKLIPLDEKIVILKKQLKELQEYIIWPYDKKLEELGTDSKLLGITRYFGKPIEKIYSSLFANLYVMHLRKKIFSIGMEINSFLEGKSRCEIFSASKNQTIEINPTVSGNSTKDERNFFSMIVCRCIELEATKIILKNFLLLTHFSVSIIRYMWSSIFEELAVSENEIILYGVKNNATEKLRELANEFELENLLCIVNIKELHKNAFSNAIISHNNSLLLPACEEKLLNVQVSPSNI